MNEWYIIFYLHLIKYRQIPKLFFLYIKSYMLAGNTKRSKKIWTGRGQILLSCCLECGNLAVFLLGSYWYNILLNISFIGHNNDSDTADNWVTSRYILPREVPIWKGCLSFSISLGIYIILSWWEGQNEQGAEKEKEEWHDHRVWDQHPTSTIRRYSFIDRCASRSMNYKRYLVQNVMCYFSSTICRVLTTYESWLK